MQAPPIDPTRDPSREAHLSPPFVPIEGVLNCRALPLAASADTKSASGSWVLRSGDISRITPLGIQQLRDRGIRTIFDLRSPGDIAKFQSPVPVIEGIEIIKAPLHQDPNGTNNEGLGWYAEDNMRNVYAEFRKDELSMFMNHYTRSLERGSKGIAMVLRSLVDRPENEGVLFHCSAGKDRTGVLAALILSLAGAEKSVIVHDYALTSAGLEPFSAAILQRFENDIAFQEERQGAMNMLSSRPETMLAFLALLRDKYGGAEGYARNVAGLSQAEVDAIKQRLNNEKS